VRTDRILENETLGALSARLGVPLCMLMRANRLASAAWLLPGREIAVPEGDFCEKDSFPCPKRLVQAVAKGKETEVFIAEAGDTIGSAARTLGTTKRLLLMTRGRGGELKEGERILIEREKCQKRIGSVLPGETAEAFCGRMGCTDEKEILRLNDVENGQLWPGMQLILPDENGV